MGWKKDAGTREVGDPRRALFAVVVAGTALSALLLRPSGSLHRSEGQVGGTLTAVLAFVWAGGCLILYQRHRRQIGFNAQLGPVERRLADAVRGVLLVAALGVPALMIGLHRLGHHSYHAKAHKKHHVSDQGGGPSGGNAPSHPSHPIGWQFLLAVVMVVVLLVVVAVAVKRLRGELVRAPKPPPDPVDEARRLADAVESGRRALLGGTDPRAAVIACYAAMEASLAASGVARQASDSPQDLLERVADSGLETGDSASALTELFREARYSTHPMGDAERDRATAALDDIAERLLGRAAFGAGVAS